MTTASSRTAKSRRRSGVQAILVRSAGAKNCSGINDSSVSEDRGPVGSGDEFAINSVLGQSSASAVSIVISSLLISLGNEDKQLLVFCQYIE
jgi:hypothetical protein